MMQEKICIWMAVMMCKSATNLYTLHDNMLQWTKMNQWKITLSVL
jgi:hypothetical protein